MSWYKHRRACLAYGSTFCIDFSARERRLRTNDSLGSIPSSVIFLPAPGTLQILKRSLVSCARKSVPRCFNASLSLLTNPHVRISRTPSETLLVSDGHRDTAISAAAYIGTMKHGSYLGRSGFCRQQKRGFEVFSVVWQGDTKKRCNKIHYDVSRERTLAAGQILRTVPIGLR